MLIEKGNIERGELGFVPTPAGTRSHRPISHIEFLTMVEKQLIENGWEISAESHIVTHEGLRHFGLLTVRSGLDTGEFTQVVGIRNSHDKRFPAGIVCGSQVLVCSNLCFSGEIAVVRKHTRFIWKQLPELVSSAVGQLREGWQNEANRIRIYHDCEVEDVDVHDLTIQALDRGVISGSKVPKVLNEYRNPQHTEFQPRTMWSWFNAVTQVLKGTSIQDLPGRTENLFGLCDDYIK